MTAEHIRRVLERYCADLRALGTEEKRHDTATIVRPLRRDWPFDTFGTNLKHLSEHTLWMAQHVLTVFLPTTGPVQMDKANRWLGWIQCALMIIGLVSIEEARDHNRATTTEASSEPMTGGDECQSESH